jgi:DNA-binding MarR family transcriptional regulator
MAPAPTKSTSSSTSSRQIDAWVRLLRVHAATTRQFNAELLAEHGLTMNDFDVLVQLAHAPEGRLRRVDLAERVLLTPSGITRLLEGLERAGYVERGSCESDARVSYALLTEAGSEKLEQAKVTHRASVKALFAERYSDQEVETLVALLERLPAVEAACEGDS